MTTSESMRESLSTLRLPSREVLCRYAIHSVWLTALFVLVYGGANRWAAERVDWHRWYFSWEAGVPFIPALVPIYLSVNLFMTCPLFVLNSREVDSYARALGIAIVVAGVLFLLFPTISAFADEAIRAENAAFLDLVRRWDRPHNLFPSLHVAFSGITWSVLVRGRPIAIQLFFGFWAILLTASVIFVHQHHLVDIAGGVALSLLSLRLADRKP